MSSKIKLSGNPVHPILVVHPTAFSSGTFVAYLVNPLARNLLRFRAGVVGAGGPAIVPGVVGAGAAGFLSWRLIRNDEAGMNTGCPPSGGMRRSWRAPWPPRNPPGTNLIRRTDKAFVSYQTSITARRRRWRHPV